MLAYCGMNCLECRAYKATVTANEEDLKKVAKEFGDGKYGDKQWVCLGCIQKDTRFVADYCAKCEIRTCAIERGVQNCAACDDYEGCGRLHGFLTKESEVLVRVMAFLRESFLARRECAGA